MSRGIPTEYAGLRFRSRLEAQWAHFFDNIGWPWQYEPIDLDGYIPDFVLPFPAGPLLVEVKGAFYVPELVPHAEKIERSGWKHEAIIVGSSPLMVAERDYWDFPLLGWLGERYDYPEDDEGGLVWDHGRMFRCRECGELSVFHELMSFHCRVNGCYDGDHYLGELRDDDLRALWHNSVKAMRWKPRGAA